MDFLIAVLSFLSIAQILAASKLEKAQADIWDNTIDETLAPSRSIKKKGRQLWDFMQEQNERDEKEVRGATLIVERGPVGPRGPPGAVVTVEKIMEEFKRMVKKTAEKRARKLLKARYPNIDIKKAISSNDLSLLYPGVDEPVETVNYIPFTFTVRLIKDMRIKPGKEIRLKNLQLSGAPAASVRGDLQASFGSDGELTVSNAGIFQFTATLTFKINHKTNRDISGGGSFIEIFICLNGSCYSEHDSTKLTGTKFIKPLEKGVRQFTVQLTSVMTMKKSEYVTIHVNNPSSRRVTVLSQATLINGVQLGI